MKREKERKRARGKIRERREEKTVFASISFEKLKQKTQEKVPQGFC